MKVLTNWTNVIVKGSGHFVLDDRFDLTKAIVEAPFNKNGMIGQ